MKKTILIIVALVAVLSIVGSTVVLAASQPASKATAKVSEIYLVGSPPAELGEFSSGESTMDWTTILEQDIKTPNGKDLFIDASLMCGLYTQTLVKSKMLTADKSTSDVAITVRVLVDGEEAAPGEVVFSRRLQQMTAKFAGYVSGEDINGDGYVDVLDIQDEELELILDTMDAHAFNFVTVDLPSGVHTVQVQARIDSMTDVDTGTAAAWATIGKGSVTIELVRMIKNEDIMELVSTD